MHTHDNPTHTRRDFLKTTAAGIAAGSVIGMAGTARGGFAGDGAFGLEKRRLGKTGMEVSVLGFGGAEIGYGRVEQERVSELLNTALDQGLDAVDTAECYVESETLIGNAIGHRRDDYSLFTKVGHWPSGKDGWSAEGITRSIERSLERLKTDHIDLVHLHSCGIDVLKEGDAIEALEKARDAGKTRFIGYSGDAAPARFAVETGRFDTLMTSLSIFDQESIDLTLPLCREQDMGVIVKRGIGNAVWRYDEFPTNGYYQEYWRRMQKLDYDFMRPANRDNTGPDGPAGIALRFVLSQHGVHTNVVGTTNPKRFAQNAELLKAGPLDAEQVEAIRTRWKDVAEEGWVGQI
ncbi:MAG: aldo/keto reductase [Planctomycetota bacterium]|nr:aldo/keto reductase [Planctomycetota bacterium]